MSILQITKVFHHPVVANLPVGQCSQLLIDCKLARNNALVYKSTVGTCTVFFLNLKKKPKKQTIQKNENRLFVTHRITNHGRRVTYVSRCNFSDRRQHGYLTDVHSTSVPRVPPPHSFVPLERVCRHVNFLKKEKKKLLAHFVVPPFLKFHK